MSKIILCMIVKNESKIIERCIRSTKDLIDGISICDTGSPDNTIEVIERVGKELGLPTKVWNHQWKNFGHNRSQSFTALTEFIKIQGWEPVKCFGLLMDADMILEVNPSFKKSNVKACGYQVIQKNTVIEYFNVRLIRCDAPWVCTGVTHEFWEQNSKTGWKGLPLESTRDIEIDDKNDGGCKADKYERDIKLLSEGLLDEPGNVRYMFYLAQSYKDIGKLDESIHWYQKRIDAGGWREEVWYSYYMKGQCLLFKEDFPKAIDTLLKGFEFYPRRVENLHTLAAHYRLKGQNQLCYLFAKKALEVPYPHGDMLFIGKNVYDYLLRVELSIVAYYVEGKKQEGLHSSNWLMMKKNLPTHCSNLTHSNIEWYCDPLPTVEKYKNEVNLPLLVPGKVEKGTFVAMNPSIITTPEGYLAIVRCVSYRVDDSGKYSFPDESGVIYSRNFVIVYDKNFKKKAEYPLIDPDPIYASDRFIGLEDCRLFEWDGVYYFICSACLTFDTPQMVLCTMSSSPIKGEYLVTSKRVLIGPKGEHATEKNWIPVIINKHLYFIYAHDGIVKLHYHNKEVKVVDRIELPYNLSFAKGSGPLHPFEDGFLGVIHETTPKMVYLTRFIYYDKKLIPQKISYPFYFLLKGREYACSSCFDHAKMNLIIGISLRDRESYFLKISKIVIKNSLKDISEMLNV